MIKKNIADELLFNELKEDSAEAVVQLGDKVQVYSAGTLVSQGNTVSGVTIYANGPNEIKVNSGGTASSTIIYSGGNLFVSGGGISDTAGIYGGGGLHVFSGAAASNTTVYQNGYFGVGLGARTYNTVIEYAGSLTVWNGGVVSGNIIHRAGNIILSSGAVADTTTINANGGLHVFSGAIASNTTVKQGGFFGVGLGATTYNTIIDSAGSLTVWGGGKVNSNTIHQAGNIILSSGAVADTTTINANGGLHVFSGAVASNTTVKQGGFFGVGLGATTYDTVIDSSGSLTVWGGGTVNNNTILQNGNIILSSGAVANQTVIIPNGALHIFKGAIAYTTNITDGAHLGIGGGGRLHGAELEYGATMTFYNGSILTGWNDLSGQVFTSGTVQAAGAYLNLEIDEENNGECIIDNLSRFTGNYRLHVTVEDDIQDEVQTGIYILANGADAFNGSVNLKIDETDAGALQLGESYSLGGLTYTLQKVGASLQLNITGSGAAPDLPPDDGTVNRIDVYGVDDVTFEEMGDMDMEEDLPAEAYIGSITGTNGKDIVTFAEDYGRFVENINLGNGDDEIHLLPDQEDGEHSDVEFLENCSIDMGEGNNIISVGAHHELDEAVEIRFGNGNDTMTVHGFVGCRIIDLGNGTNNFTISDDCVEVFEDIRGGNGNDTITISNGGTLCMNDSEGMVELGAGNDTINIGANSKLETTLLEFGDGNDTLILNGILDFFPESEEGITGLENLSGKGTVVIHEVMGFDEKSIYDETIARFANAGHDIINAGNAWIGPSTRAEELADNQFNTARDMGYEDELDVWLCGSSAARTLDYGLCDDVDYIKFVIQDDDEWLFASFGNQGSVNLEIFSASGTSVANFTCSSFAAYDISNLNPGEEYIVKFSVNANACVGGWFEIE